MAGWRLHLEVFDVEETGAKITCVHASNRFIVCGTKDGYARLFAVRVGKETLLDSNALCGCVDLFFFCV